MFFQKHAFSIIVKLAQLIIIFRMTLVSSILGHFKADESRTKAKKIFYANFLPQYKENIKWQFQTIQVLCLVFSQYIYSDFLTMSDPLVANTICTFLF